jgi:hypothetical protein
MHPHSLPQVVLYVWNRAPMQYSYGRPCWVYLTLFPLDRKILHQPYEGICVISNTKECLIKAENNIYVLFE